MKKVRVIATKNLPVRPPVALTLSVCLLTDRFKAPGWVWGIVGTVLVILWLILLTAISLQKPVDVLNKEV